MPKWRMLVNQQFLPALTATPYTTLQLALHHMPIQHFATARGVLRSSPACPIQAFLAGAQRTMQSVSKVFPMCLL